MPQVSNYDRHHGRSGGHAGQFLANAVTNPDQLRQRVAFALSQIFVTSLEKLIIWNGNMESIKTCCWPMHSPTIARSWKT